MVGIVMTRKENKRGGRKKKGRKKTELKYVV